MAELAFWRGLSGRVEVGLSNKICRFFSGMAVLAISLGLGSGMARADSVWAGLTSPLFPTGGTETVVDLSGITAASQSTISAPGYSVSFSNVGSEQGVVQGNAPGLHFIPVAGAVGSQPEYLTGGYGSALTANAAASGNYFCTGFGKITITFTSPQDSLVLLWGSDDPGNTLSLNDAANFTISGLQFANLFYSEGYTKVPVGNSAYIDISTSTPFTTLTASTVFSTYIGTFEFAGVAASTAHSSLVGPDVPEPASGVLVLLALGLAGILGSRVTKQRVG